MTVERYHLEGHGRSVEAERAEEQGAMPASRAARALGLRSPRYVARLFPRAGIYKVGKYGMHVVYYDVSTRAIRALLEQNQEADEQTLAPAAARLSHYTTTCFTKAGHRRFCAQLWDLVRTAQQHRQAA
ncbi:MAG TPA: hypothetical protein VNF68_10420 [Candidatus Baltobacteraceae bacterium]|nr:hypothetical protein [Candidatus Baltobacteraceae bacterium]